MNTYLYDTATRDSETNRRIVKIGIANNIERREKELNQYNPQGRIIASGAGDAEYETDLHRGYAKYQFAREFFALPEKQIEELTKEMGTHEVQEIRSREAQQKRRTRMLLKSLRHYRVMGWY